ncbi:MAG: KEOPS complex subunit Cgi121 [Archaeoglobales archaeon]|nr:KEOPS complex subunit Cgi121 [Archaeoglobales archaeon]
MKIIFGEVFVEDPRYFTEIATFIDSKYVIDLETVRFAAEKALKAWNKGEKISKSLSLEVLLYYAATRQIKDATKLGIKKGLKRYAVVLFNEEERLKMNIRELNFKPEYDIDAIMKHYEISKEELEIVGVEKIPMVVRERIALFSVFKE